MLIALQDVISVQYTSVPLASVYNAVKYLLLHDSTHNLSFILLVDLNLVVSDS